MTKKWIVNKIDVNHCNFSIIFKSSDVFCSYYLDSYSFITTCPYKRKSIKDGMLDNDK
jgi:hypothetical protein